MERDRPEVNASGGNVGRLKFCSGICAALACDGSTACPANSCSVLVFRYGEAISHSDTNKLLLTFKCGSVVLDVR